MVLSPLERSKIASDAARARWDTASGASIYIIGPDVGPLKVGVSADPIKRLKGVQSGHPLALSIKATFEVGSLPPYEVETLAHSLLRDSRLKGEWFACSFEEASAAVAQALGEIAEYRDAIESRITDAEEAERTGEIVRTIFVDEELYADFARIARDRGDNFNNAVVTLMRGVVVDSRRTER